jgi:signal peptidase I
VSEAEQDAAVGPVVASTGARTLWEQAGALGLALLIAVGIRAFAFEPFRIPSGSMFPTLLVGDHLFVNKFVYGIRAPFGEARLPGIRAPERGDIVVFTVARDGNETVPADRRPELPREAFVKRVIGLPGDRIAFRDGEVFVNGERVEVMDSGEVFEDDYGRHLDVREVALGERRFRILDDPGIRLSPEGERIVEEGRYFMLGDNRDHSKDSRDWGTVRLAEIEGPAFVLYWSWDFNGRWIELLNPATWWRAELRWERFGALLN